MTHAEKTSELIASLGYPADWDAETFRRNLNEYLDLLAQQGEISIPVKRVRFQVEDSSVYQDLLKQWAKLSATERLNGWKNLLEAIEGISREVLPACTQCGECCRKGSPTLHKEDLEILREGKLPWNALFTLRPGEPVKSAIRNELLFLKEDRIKIREKSGSEECIFFNGEKDLCSIYADRPVQCRAQACWDPKEATQLANEPFLTRGEIFEGVDLVLDLIGEHEKRCSFEKLNEAFKRLEESKGETVDQVLELLAYEDHFRHFFAGRLNIAADTLELVFGRGFADLVSLFGFEVRTEPDGTRRLAPENS